MRETILGNHIRKVPSVAVGCMRLSEKSKDEMNHFIHAALEQGAYFFDHADIYGGGMSESIFGEAFADDPSLKREDMYLQSKCGIRQGFYDFSKEHILKSVDGILQRLHTDYLDLLLLHRPDALVEPEEVAAAFDVLFESGKVRNFGVSNHKPMQIELLQKYVRQPLVVNQVQFSIPVSNLVANGMEVNMETPGSIDHDGSLLDYCRLHNITLQALSPFQMPAWKGCFLGSDEYPELNQKLQVIAEKYNVSDTTIAAAWILRHPANMQIITGTASESRLKEIIAACDITLTREEWYELYLAAGHLLP
ncbi:aldo/keto reductase [Agathobacter rectalis]|uniref:aldo/keto reductase n=1 Tax=Agathobacter rectalis TaxID=39491 RepID=UPI0035659E10